MPRLVLSLFLLSLSVSPARADPFQTGKPDIRSMSALAFGPEGVLFVGRRQGRRRLRRRPRARAAARGQGARRRSPTSRASWRRSWAPRRPTCMVHDLAVNPIVQAAVPRGVARPRRPGTSSGCSPTTSPTRACWCGSTPTASPRWWISPPCAIARVALPNPSTRRRRSRGRRRLAARGRPSPTWPTPTVRCTWRDSRTRSSRPRCGRWRIPSRAPSPRPPSRTTTARTASTRRRRPVRTFVPYPLKGKTHLLAAYLCTPLVTFPVDDLQDKQHVRGRTVGEFGSGNYPLDMVLVKKEGKREARHRQQQPAAHGRRPGGRRGLRGRASTEAGRAYTARRALRAALGHGHPADGQPRREHVLVLPAS